MIDTTTNKVISTVPIPVQDGEYYNDHIVSTVRAAHEAGVRQLWLPQNFDYDALALAALVGLAVPGLGVGTSVVPINSRLPV